MRKKLSKSLLYVGIVLIAIALILGGVQDLRFYNIYGGETSKWYFYSSVGIILLIGVALVVWSYMRQRPQKQLPGEIRSTNFLVIDEENVVHAPKR
jgi:NADH:ubiquinone oxidoreductase subunit 6 (subunit J)